MSVLSFPRLYFSGEMASNPNTPNNRSTNYNSSDNTAQLNGNTEEQFERDLLAGGGDWNVYGANGINFVDYDDTLARKTVITGGALPSSQAVPSNDPLIGKGVQIEGNIFNDRRNPGRLVDLDPYSAGWGSQIFFDRFVIGDDRAGLAGKSSPHRTYAYWIGSRNYAGQAVLQIAGGASVIFQFAIPKSELQFYNTENSPLLAALEAAANQNGVAGLMVRFSAYRTLYFQNGKRNHISPAAATQEELSQYYLQGDVFYNPAYSLIVGSVGLWNEGELATAPGGRYLGTPTKVKPLFGSYPIPSEGITLKPMLAQLNRDRDILSLDALDTFPEFDKDANKMDFGPVRVQVVNSDNSITNVATLNYSNYNKTAYEATAGIIDIPVTSELADKIENGRLALSVCQVKSWWLQSVRALEENEYLVLTDDRGIYLEEATTQTCTLRVFQKGQPIAAGTEVRLAQYDSSQGNFIGNDDPKRFATLSAETITVGDDGLATFNVNPENAGNCVIAFLLPDSSPPSELPSDFFEYGYFNNIRVMPFNNELTQKPNEELTWDFMYEQIFQVYNLVYPIMSQVIPMDDRQLMEGAYPQILAVIGESDDATHTSSMFDSTMYMSVTRDLSYGHREVLRRWCLLVSRDSQP